MYRSNLSKPISSDTIEIFSSLGSLEKLKTEWFTRAMSAITHNQTNPNNRIDFERHKGQYMTDYLRGMLNQYKKEFLSEKSKFTALFADAFYVDNYFLACQRNKSSDYPKGFMLIAQVDIENIEDRFQFLLWLEDQEHLFRL